MNKMEKQKLPKKIKRKLSDFKWKTGYFYSKKNKKKYKFRSSYEKAIFKILENDKNVIKYEYEPIILFFHYKGRMKRYFPDLLVQYTNNSYKLIEIKPKWRFLNISLYLKSQLLVAKDYAERHNMIFEVWNWNEKENKIEIIDWK